MSEMPTERLLAIHRTMETIRAFEERVGREFRTGEIPGFVHSYAGQEAVAATICAHLRQDDLIASTHRGHGHCIAKGCELQGMMAEIYGREDGLCHGRGGSMHIADFSRGMLGANAIVGGGIALATGGALSAQVRGTDQVAVAFFGDGAASQGVLHESMNLAAIWSLPVLFVCENNGTAESTPAAYAISVADVATRAAGYGMPGVTVDSADLDALDAVAGAAVARARGGEGPTLLEARTYRLAGHFVGDPEVYRNEGDRDALVAADPLATLRERLLSDGRLTDETLAALRREIEAEIDGAVTFARNSPWPDSDDIDRYVYSGVA
jgi:acetoin:2,6-dichlorophenolindophenol oxidoreductase subunit alpha